MVGPCAKCSRRARTNIKWPRGPEGRCDREAPAQHAERDFDLLNASRKELIWFERSAHFVNTEEAEKFNRFFVERLRQETRRYASWPASLKPSSPR